MLEILGNALTDNGLIVAFTVVGLTMFVSYFLSDKLTKGRIHGSAIAIALGLVLAYIGGMVTGGEKGLSDIGIFAGIGLMGGGMLRDFAIVATAFGANFSEIKKSRCKWRCFPLFGCCPLLYNRSWNCPGIWIY